ncbi:Protein of unknown function [Desulfonispora thiosulfatigenes DSM 11270]|uniref:DUF3793 family protein n=1 Tax=Desulfonispora thiosulfatigenes DSM 11270 TaxID=656914 RepID=A0A1W1VT69_DESTI|nr:DUF3793 family protein [Desulfonispora thiosulfatigenes]SMB96549.1 Protein of unknown function [Desulfonispora thiosulfatigenes DSM 11270]
MFNLPTNETNIIFKLIGATIMGVKPAELINVKIGQGFENCKNALVNYPEINLMEIKELKREPRMQVFFYHKTVLEEVFMKKCNQNFLYNMGYNLQNSLVDNLEILRSRLQKEEFPHEVGLFLGYPLKDVLGFMGMYPLEFVGARGWRYYGSLELSQSYYNKYQKAKESFAQELYKEDNYKMN